MNPPLRSDLRNLTKQDNIDNKITSSYEKNVQNVITDNKSVKPKKIIKKIIEINPEKIKNLGIADQILAAVRKLDANNDLPPSMDIDLTKIKTLNTQKLPIKSKKSLEPLPSTSKLSIQPIEKKFKIINNNEKLNNAKGTLNKFLQGRQNSKLNNLSDSIKSQEIEENSGNIKPSAKRLYHTQKSKTLKSTNEDNNFTNSTELQEQLMLNSILHEDQITSEINKNELNEQQNLNASNDNLLLNDSINQNNRQRKISESIKIANQSEPKVRILHELKSDKKLTEDKIQKTPKSIDESNLMKTNLSSEIMLPNVSPLKISNTNTLYENYDIDGDTKIPSFSDLTSHIIEKWRNESEVNQTTTGTDSNKTENLPKINNLKTESEQNSNPPTSIARRRKIIPTSILNIKKNLDNSINNTQAKEIISKVIVNINGAQVTNYEPIMSRKRKISENIIENSNTVNIKNKIIKIQDKFTENLSITVNIQENNLNCELKSQQENIENNSKSTTDQLQNKNFNLRGETFKENNLLINNEAMTFENNPKVEEQIQEIEENSLNTSIKSEQDGVDFLINLGDTINQTDVYNVSSSDSDESNSDSDNSDFFKKFPTLQNQTIKTEEIHLTGNDDSNENNNTFDIYDDITNNDDDNDIESPNYESLSINNIENFQQNQNQLLVNSINSQTTSPTQRKPIVIENKILKDDEKIDLIYLNNIPHFETPTKGNHEIGQTILLKPCKAKDFNKQTFNIADHSYNETALNENLTISDFTENNENTKNEIITINKEICTSVNDDSNQNISNICYVENMDNQLKVKDEINNPSDSEILQVNSSQTLSSSISNQENAEILNITHDKNKNKNKLENHIVQNHDNNMINNEKNIENENTQMEFLENNVKQNKPPIKSRRLRGGKINLISRNKPNNKKSNDDSILKNIEELSKITEPAKKTTNNSTQEVIVNDETSLTKLNNIKSNDEILGDNRLPEISNTPEIFLIDPSKCIRENTSNILDNSTTLNIEKEVKIQEENIKLNVISNTLENISNKLKKNESTNVVSLNKNISENNLELLDKTSTVHLEKLEEQDKMALTEPEEPELKEENLKENVISKLKISNENIFSGTINDNSTVQNAFDEDISINSSLNDSLEMEEPFHGFDDIEMKLDNYEMKKETVEKLSISDSILNKDTIPNNTNDLNKNELENYKNECDMLSINNTEAEISQIKDNISKSIDQRGDSTAQRHTPTNLEEDALKSIKNEKNKLKNTPEKSEITRSRISNIQETAVNLKKSEDVLTDSEGEPIILKKASKRRILDSSEDDDDNVPLKKQLKEHTISKERTTKDLSKSEKTNSEKLNNNMKHQKLILRKSEITDDKVLSTKKSSNLQRKSKTKTPKNENDQKINNPLGPEITTPIENDIKDNILPKNRENISSVVRKTDVKNSSDMINLVDKTQFETDITNSNISTPILPKSRGRKPKNVNEKIEVIVEIDKDIIDGNNSTTKPARGRGRGRKAIDRKIHPRLLLITNREDIDIEDKNVNDRKKLQKNEIQCGMCKEVMLKTVWEKHKIVHYGVGWKMDEEPIDLSSHSAVLSALINCFKNRKIKSLPCRICNKKFGSGLGLLVHLEMCGLTEDEKRNQCYVKCEHCSGEFARYSLPNHLRSCKNLKSKLNLENDETEEDNTNNDINFVINNTGRLKRQSMIRAENKFKDLEKTDFDVGDFIRSVTSVRGGHFRKWKKEIETNGSANCIGTGCNFKCDSYDEIRAHVKNCKYLTKTGYRCTRCKYHNESIDAVRQHILNEHKFSKKDFHSGSESDDNYKNVNCDTSTEDESSGVDENEEEIRSVIDDADSDNDNKSKKTEKRIRENTIKSSNKFKKIIDIERSYNDKVKFQNWTNFFYQYNYTNSILFPNIKINCKPSNMKLDLFQPKNLLSMKFSFSNNPMNQTFNSSKPLTEWMEMEHLKSATFENELLIFIGGPITSVKWLPTANETTTPQYLAITYKRNNKFIHCTNPHKQKTLILIYKIGSITQFQNKENLGNFEYGITYNDGPINDIDFLPSGGYIPEINRLGLLSIASINNDIIIYSLPIKATETCDNINNFINLIDLKIAIQLKLKLLTLKNDKSDEIYNVSATKIVWSKAKGHKTVVAGYTNGFIAIWNLTEEDNLNYMEINDTPTYLPVNYFRASNKSITGLDLHYDRNGTRWLITSTIDRNYKVIDIENPCNPIIITEDINKTFITSIVWPLIWENPCYSTSDELNQSSIQTLNPLIIYYKQRRYSRHSSSINDISFNNWYNIMACGGNNGDFSIEFNGKMNLDVSQKQEKKLHSYTDLMQLNNEKIIDKSLTDTMTFFDTDFRNKYGLIFGPIKYVHKDLTFLQKKRNPPINMNFYVKINRVDCNNNENGKQLFAIGYENGFVRILYINDNSLRNTVKP